MQKTGSYNIAIYPSANIRQSAIEVSKACQGIFTLDDINFFPHISLYMTEFPLKNLEKINHAIEKIAVSTDAFYLEQNEYRIDDGYFDMSFKSSENILNLQKVIVEALNPLREEVLREKDKLRIETSSKEESKNISTYGYSYIGEQLVPHITFTRFDKPTKVSKKEIDFSFMTSEIGLFELGDNGTCRKKIKIYTLRK